MSQTIAERIAGLPDDELAALSTAMAAGVDEGRRAGFPAVAGWYDALGRLLDHERDWRRGEPSTLPLAGATALVRAAEALSGRELAAVTLGVIAALYGLPDGPAWAYLAAVLGLLRTEHGGGRTARRAARGGCARCLARDRWGGPRAP